MVMPYVTDTHSMIWYITGDPKLSVEARKTFEKADHGQDNIFISCISFFELLYLTEKRKIVVEFDKLISAVSASRNYRIEPLCLPIILRSRAIPREDIPDPWDRLIAATSIHLGFPLITRDKSLQKIGLKTIW
jgi:PIN domain nuclease of toxin-antitoxin system